MSEFQEFDDQLASALQSRAGSGAGSVAAAHEAVLARAGLIRRRRAAAVGGIATIALVIGGVALLPRDGGNTLAPGATGDVLTSIDSSIATTTVDGVPGPTSTGPDSDDESSGGESNDNSTATTVDVDESTTLPGVAPGGTSTVAGSTPTTSAPTGSSPSTTNGDGSGTTGPDESTSTSGATPPPINPFTETYSSTGGSIMVDWDGSVLSLLAVSPVVGFDSEIEHDEPLRIRVRFRSDDDDSRIEVRVSDGVVVVDIS